MIRTAKRTKKRDDDKPGDQFNEQSLPNFTYDSVVEWYSNLSPEKLEELEKASKRKPGPVPSGKKLLTLRLDTDIIEAFRATGKGWQARMNDALKAAKA